MSKGDLILLGNSINDFIYSEIKFKNINDIANRNNVSKIRILE